MKIDSSATLGLHARALGVMLLFPVVRVDKHAPSFNVHVLEASLRNLQVDEMVMAENG